MLHALGLKSRARRLGLGLEIRVILLSTFGTKRALDLVFLWIFLDTCMDTCRMTTRISKRPRGPADTSPKTDPSSLDVLLAILSSYFYRLCHHNIIIQHIPLGHHSLREELSNDLIASTFN